MESTSLLLLGFMLGMRHALDPDHVVAVTAIMSHEGTLRRAQWTGALWGIGHSATVFFVGGSIALFKLVVAPGVIVGLEFCVALMLIVLGVANLASRARIGAVGAARPLAVGFMHGLAGSAFIAMLVSTSLPTPMMIGWYLLLFGVGTVIGMMVLTSAIAMPALYLTGRYSEAGRHLRFASGIASIAFGVLLAQRGISAGVLEGISIWGTR